MRRQTIRASSTDAVEVGDSIDHKFPLTLLLKNGMDGRKIQVGLKVAQAENESGCMAATRPHFHWCNPITLCT